MLMDKLLLRSIIYTAITLVEYFKLIYLIVNKKNVIPSQIDRFNQFKSSTITVAKFQLSSQAKSLKNILNLEVS